MATQKRGRERREKRRTAQTENRCRECIPAKCCMYLSVEVDKPESMKDYDDMLWLIAHRDVEIYMDEGRWFVMVQNPCRFFDPMKGCLIYPKRPRICRSHTLRECEFEDEYDFELHFHSYEELDRYIRARATSGARRISRAKTGRSSGRSNPHQRSKTILRESSKTPTRRRKK